MIALYLFLAFAAGFVFAVYHARDTHKTLAREIEKIRREKHELQARYNAKCSESSELNRMLYGDLAGDESDWWKGDGKN